ncbi:hypothetical protein Tco_1556570 [Tanacetum coccineum]
MVESLPTMVDTHIKEQVKKQVPEKVRTQVLVYVAEGLIMERQKNKDEMDKMIAKAILQEQQPWTSNMGLHLRDEVLESPGYHKLIIEQSWPEDIEYEAYCWSVIVLDNVNEGTRMMMKDRMKQVSQDIMERNRVDMVFISIQSEFNVMGKECMIVNLEIEVINRKIEKKEKREMNETFRDSMSVCDTTLLEYLIRFTSVTIMDVKYGYVQRELTNDEVEYLKLFEEDIEVRLKYRNHMRRWEMYVNGRPLRHVGNAEIIINTLGGDC